MKFKLLKVFVFLAFIIAADKTIGFICRKLYNNSNDFFISKLRHTLNSANEDVLIFGSSRAEYHFIPEIINRGTGLSIYNCGIGGADLLFSKIQLNESLKRYKPRYVIIEASPSSFFIPNADNNRRMLLPFYKKDTMLYNMLTNNEPFEKIKFASSIYPYNSTIASLLKGVFKSSGDSAKGFLPAAGIIDTTDLARAVDNSFAMALLPEHKFTYLKELIEICIANNIRVVVASTPVYRANGNHDKMVDQLKAFCRQYKNLVYLDYSKYEHTYLRKDLFKDNSHLNHEGAVVFSKTFSGDFKNAIGL